MLSILHKNILSQLILEPFQEENWGKLWKGQFWKMSNEESQGPQSASCRRTECQLKGSSSLLDRATSSLLHSFFPLIQKYFQLVWFLSTLPIQARSTASTPVFYLCPFLPPLSLYRGIDAETRRKSLLIPLGTGSQKHRPVLRLALRRNHQCCQTDCAGQWAGPAATHLTANPWGDDFSISSLLPNHTLGQ